jgi:peptide/nickel transport system permease protein
MWLVATTVFIALRSIPGGPVQSVLGPLATEEMIADVEQRLGVDQPLHIQYIDWMTDLLVLDFGRSLTSGETVNTLIIQAAPKTGSIAFMSVIIGLGIAIPTGIISATRKNEPVDYVATTVAFWGLSMPAFFVGILLALIFGVQLGMFPVFGYESLTKEGFVPWLRSILLPSIAVGTPYAAIVMRMLRSSILDVKNKDYMRTAQAKGVSNRIRLYKHGLQNAFIPVITIAGIQLALILTGSVTTEIVFGIQGFGRLLVNSMLDRDYTLIQGIILVVAFIMVSVNIIVDISYAYLNPQIKYDGDES